MHDKPFLRILNIIADWIIRIVVLNVFMVVLTIPIVTFYAGYKAAYSLFVDYTEDKTTPLFRGFWENLKKDFWRDVGVGALFLILLAVGVLGAYNYLRMLQNDEGNVMYTLGFLITAGFSLLFIMTMIYSVTVLYIAPEISLKNLFKVSLVVTGKYFFRSIVVIIITIAPVFLMISPMLMPIFVFVGLSVPLVLNVLLMRKPRRFLRGENKSV